MSPTVRQLRTHTVADARLASYGLGHPLPVEMVALPYALDRYLAEPVLALTDLPGSPTAAVDGWAVAGQGPWQVLPGRLPANPAGQRLAVGSAQEIAAGANVPRGADGVLRREDGHLAEGILYGALRSSRELRDKGAEFRTGDVLAAPGMRVSPPVVGLAAAAGHDEVCVARRPRVSLVVLGAGRGSAFRPLVGRIRDSLGPQLPMWVQLLGGQVTTTHRVSDNRADTVGALCARADVIVTTTGTAAGSSDHLPGALAVLGADIVVDGVDIRPGHPMLLARRPDGIPVIGLPGNPPAAVAGLLTFLEPLIARLTGRALPSLRTTVLADGVPATADSGSQLVPVAIDDGGIATLMPHAGPAMLRGLAAADALAIVPPGGAESGVRIAVLDLPWRDVSRDVSRAGGQLGE